MIMVTQVSALKLPFLQELGDVNRLKADFIMPIGAWKVQTGWTVYGCRPLI